MSISRWVQQINLCTLAELKPVNTKLKRALNQYLPDVAVDHFFETTSPSCPYVYADLDHYLIVPLMLTSSKHPDRSLCHHFQRVLTQAQTASARRDYRQLFALTATPFLVELMDILIQHEPMTSDFQEACLTVYTQQDFGFGQLQPASVEKLFTIETPPVSLPVSSEWVTVYRGEGDRSTPYQRAYSWTLDQNVAYFFACRYASAGQKTGRVVTARVQAAAIRHYVAGEEEVLILPQDVSVVSVQQLISAAEGLPDLLSLIMADYQACREHIRALYDYYRPGCHGASHTLRVSFLALTLATDYDLSEEALDYLKTACVYHDIARQTDGKEPEHGANAATAYRELTGDSSPEIAFLLTYHSLPDELAQAALPEGDEELWLLYQLLKDADALDRVRFGAHSLDISYLRLPFSFELVFLAHQTVTNLQL